jgi:hypothetical protein
VALTSLPLRLTLLDAWILRTRKRNDDVIACAGRAVLLFTSGGRSECRRRSRAVHELDRSTLWSNGLQRPTGYYRLGFGRCFLPLYLSPPYQRLARVGRPHQRFPCPVGLVPLGLVPVGLVPAGFLPVDLVVANGAPFLPEIVWYR